MFPSSRATAALLVASLLPITLRAQTTPPTEPTTRPAVAAPAPADHGRLKVDLSIDRGLVLEHDKFGLEAHFLLYQTAGFALGDVHKAGFNIVYARPQLRGFALTKRLTYFIQAELAGPSSGPKLLDAQLAFKVHEAFQLTAGQLITPLSREFLVPPFRLIFGDYAPSTQYFRGNRDRGGMVFGLVGGLEYYAGYFDGNGIQTSNVNDNAQGEVIGRLVYNLVGPSSYDQVPQLASKSATHLAVGTSGAHNDKEVSATNGTTTTKLGSVAQDTAAVDVVMSYGPLLAEAEGFYQATRDRPTTEKLHRVGGHALLGLFVWPKTIQLAARGDVVKFDTHEGPTTRQLAGQVAWYVRGQHLKVQARYAYQNTTAANPILPKGTTHDFQLGLQLFF